MNAMTPAMQILRKQNPSMRRTSPVGITHSGGKQTLYDCVCGASHSVATRNRGTTKHERTFFAAHADCAARLVAEMPLVVDPSDAL